MKAPTSALLAAALAAVPVVALDPARPPAPPPTPQPTSRSPDLRHSAIGFLIDANGGRVPATGAELTRALAKLGRPVQLPFPFSSVSLDSGLSHPRVVLTLRPTPSKEVIPFTPVGGWGGSGSGSDQIVSRPIPTAGATSPSLEGRLFLAANMEAGTGGREPRVRTVEFISWNSRRLRFDFGVIEGMGSTPELRLVDGGRCFSCHKNRGPILGVGPWSNSAHNDIVRAASAPRFSLAPTPFAHPEFDGMAVLDPSAPEVEAAVRAGAAMLRDREVFRAMANTREGRRALIMLFRAVVESGPLDQIERRVRRDLAGKFALAPFVADSVAIQKAAASDFLADFGPSGSVGRVTGNTVAWGGTAEGVTGYDARRAAGQTPLPPEHVPSNPGAFLRPPVNASPNPADHAGAVKLARALGLTEGDREFLAVTLRQAASRVKDKVLAPGSLALDVFIGPEFADVLAGGPLPDRDEFKDRFVAGILGTRVAGTAYWGQRGDYAKTPRIDRAAEEKEADSAPAVPTSFCLGCHEVPKAGKRPEFSPIPALPFDPFDAATRGAWARTTDRKRKAEVLARLLQRLGTDKDMPPPDSAEAAFRDRDPAAFAAVVEWLEAELRKAKAR